MYRKAIAAIAAFTTSAILATSASATVFQRDYHPEQVWTAYDNVNETYSMKFNAGTNDGFWLVASTGENPKYNTEEYAILYGDLTTNRITAYVYDGENSANSFQTSDFLGSFEAPFVDMGGGMVQFDLDVAAINGAFNTPEWEGVQIGNQAGIWFHQSTGSDFSYGANGELLDYSFGSEMWLDRGFDLTFEYASVDCNDLLQGAGFGNSCAPTGLTPGIGLSGGSVPVPGGLAFILIGAAGFAARRRK